jgi:hypothetical protein
MNVIERILYSIQVHHVLNSLLRITYNWGLKYCDVLPKKPANQRFIARQQLRKYAIVDEAVFPPCRADDSRPEPRTNRYSRRIASHNFNSFNKPENRDSSVGIATGYWLDDWGVGVRVPVESRIFTSPCRPDRLWGSPNLLFNEYRGLFHQE